MDSDDEPWGASDDDPVAVGDYYYDCSDGGSGGAGGGGEDEGSDCAGDDYEVREEVASMREKVPSIAPLAGSGICIFRVAGLGRERDDRTVPLRVISGAGCGGFLNARRSRSAGAQFGAGFLLRGQKPSRGSSKGRRSGALALHLIVSRRCGSRCDDGRVQSVCCAPGTWRCCPAVSPER